MAEFVPFRRRFAPKAEEVAKPTEEKLTRSGEFTRAAGLPTDESGVTVPLLNETGLFDQEEAAVRRRARRAEKETTNSDVSTGSSANVAKENVVGDVNAAELAQQGLIASGPRSAREEARRNLRKLTEGTGARKVSAEEKAQQSITDKQAERERINAENKERKVQAIYQANLPALQILSSKKADYEAHPASQLGAAELSHAAELAHSVLTSFIANPEKHFIDHAKLHDKVADQIEKVVPGHPIAGQLRGRAFTLRGFAERSLSNKDRLGVARPFTGPGSANDALVNIGAQPMKLMRDARSQTTEKMIAGDRRNPVVTVANPSQTIASRTQDLYTKLISAHKLISKTLYDDPQLAGSIPVSRTELEFGRRRAGELVASGGDRLPVGKAPVWKLHSLNSVITSSSGVRHPEKIDPAKLPEEHRAYADSSGYVVDESGRRYRKTDAGVSPHPTHFWKSVSEPIAKPSNELGYSSTTVPTGAPRTR